MLVDLAIVIFVAVFLIITCLRYAVNLENKKNKRKTLREMIIITCIGILWIFAATYLYVYKTNATLGLIAILVGTLLVFGLVAAQIKKIYRGLYTGATIRKRELIIQYAFIFLYITIFYTFVNITIYSYNSDAFVFIVEKSGDFTCITDLVVTFIYFTVSTVTSLGYGDIVPVNTLAKAFVSVQNFTAFGAVSILLSLIMVEKKKNVTKKTKETVENEVKKEIEKEMENLKEEMEIKNSI